MTKSGFWLSDRTDNFTKKGSIEQNDVKVRCFVSATFFWLWFCENLAVWPLLLDCFVEILFLVPAYIFLKQFSQFVLQDTDPLLKDYFLCNVS